MKASTRKVSCRVGELPTLRTSIPSVLLPTLSSGCSLTPRWGGTEDSGGGEKEGRLVDDAIFNDYIRWAETSER